MGSVLLEILALLLSWTLGLALTRPLFNLSALSTRCLWIVISWGLGAGVSSLIWFVFFFCLHLPPLPVAGIEVTLLAYLLFRPRNRSAIIIGPTLRAEAGFTRILLILGIVCLCSSVWYGLLYNWVSPHGDWDGYAIWNLHARILYRAHNWPNRLRPIAYSHPDYPLLEPITIARLWILGGNELSSARIFVTMLFGFTPALVAAAALAVLRSWTHAAIALLFLLGFNQFTHLSINQYADAAEGLFILSTFILFICAIVFGQNRLLFLAGLSGGLAAWTKNEGSLFLAALIAVGLLHALVRGDLRQRWKLTLPFAYGLVLPVLALVVFKALVHASSDVVGPMLEFKRWADGFSWTRISLILKQYGIQFWTTSDWAIPPLVWLAILLDATGVGGSPLLSRCARSGLAVLAAMFAGYIAIYATSTHDLETYMSTSLQRLILQIWPAFVFLIFLLIRAPILVWGYSFNRLNKP